MLVGALAYATYVARIGGDMLYHRYASLPVCLLLCAAGGIAEAALLALPAQRFRNVASVIVAVAVCGVFGLGYPVQLESHPIGLPQATHLWQQISDPTWHRRHHALAYTAMRAAEDRERRAAYARVRADGETAQPEISVQGFCRHAFEMFDAEIVHEYGLTDAVLSRLPRGFERVGHKRVRREAQEIRNLRLRARELPARAWYELPEAPAWVKTNLAELRRLDRKVHNRHGWRENLSLALHPIRLT